MLRIIRPCLVVLFVFLILIGAAFLGTYPAKSGLINQCLHTCGDGICAQNICVSHPCGCIENALTCPQDCHTGLHNETI